MPAELLNADIARITVDLAEVTTIEPKGPYTVLHFADGTRVVVSDLGEVSLAGGSSAMRGAIGGTRDELAGVEARSEAEIAELASRD